MSIRESRAVVVLLNRIATALEKIASTVDDERKCIRMVDVDRAKVYSTHLGKTLRPESAPELSESVGKGGA